MVKKENWIDRPSQWLNAGIFLSSLLVITVPLALLRWKNTKKTVFEISIDKINVHSSFLTTSTKSMNIADIEKIIIQEPFFLKLFSLSNLIIISNDFNNRLVFAGIRNGHLVGDELERLITANIDAKLI
jgi:hypothetical protein